MSKFWRKLSISHKLFACIAIIFSAVLILLFIGQLFFYERYYYFLLEADMKKNLTEFSEKYAGLSSADDIKKTITDYSNSGNSFIFVLDKNGNIMHMSGYDMCVENNSGSYHILLDNAVQDKNFMNLGLKENTEIKITYYKNSFLPPNSELIIPIRIEYNGKVWTYKKHPQYSLRPLPPGNNNETRDITGKITSLSLPSNVNSQFSIQKNEAFDAVMSWRENKNVIPPNGGFKKYQYTNNENDSKYCIVAYNPPNSDEYILSAKPLHSVSEAVYVLKGIIELWFICTLIIALIISVIFSRIVTRPVIRITDATKRIKNLDFSTECAVLSGDEIGILAENINDMSQKLNKTINELIKANKQLKLDIEHERILERQRKEFVAVVSHELKTPLAIIRAYSEGILDGVSQAKQEKYIKVIVSETQKMDALILDMLEDSKLEIGAQHIDLRSCDLADFTKNIVNKFRAPCQSENIKLTENISKTPIMRKFDRDMLEQVLSNFILNAIRYAQNKQIVITANEEMVSVENEGKHIAEDELDKIWNKFYCVGNSAKHFTGGTGLGLSIAKNILNLHNAEFGVKNTDMGVMFWFSLPKIE